MMRGARNATIVPHGKHLSIEPPSINFENIEANMKYIQTLVVRNLSTYVKRIRFQVPKSQEFRIVTENEIGVAPGLSVSVDVEFLTRKVDDFFDKLVVVAEDFRGEVELCAQRPQEKARKGEGAVTTMARQVSPTDATEKADRKKNELPTEELNPALPKLETSSVVPSIKVSPDMLHFGQCPVNHRRDIVLRITNSSPPNTSVEFEIPRVSHMRVHPMKGKLAAGQSTNVVVSFMPKALGKYNQDISIKYGNSQYSHTLHCYGEAPVLGEKPVPVKGLERTGRDFDPEYIYVNQEQLNLPPKARNLQSLTKIMKEDLERNQYSSDALDSIMMDLPEPTPYSLSPSAMQEYVRNKQRYNKLLKDSRIRRKIRQKEELHPSEPVDIFYEDDVNMGMLPGSGLKSPRYNVCEIPVDKLHLERALDDDSAAEGVTGHRYMHDENKLIKKKYKAGPTTQAEVRECSASLETWQLGLISFGPAVLDFGNVYVKSTVVKSFSVFNDLPQAILVAMQYDAEELSRSTPTSQVVPSAHAAGFDVSVCSATPQNFQRQVVYTINGIHPYKLLVKATITPVQIRMSRADLNFRFSEDSLEKTLSEKLMLDNPGNAPAKFSWQGANQSFAVSPVSGVIPRGGSQGVEVIFTPPNSGQTMEGYLTLKVEDGNDHSLRCVGQAPEATLNFGVKRLDLGVLAVGLPADRSIPIVNGGKNVAVYHVDSVPDGVGISPMRGRVLPEGRAEIDVHVLLDRPMQLESAVTLNVRGGKPIRLPIMATAVNPNIEFMEDEIEFGQLTLGAQGVVPISLKNSSAVEGTHYVNLQPYPEFSLSLLEERQDTVYDADYDANALQPISLQQYQLAIGGVTEAQAAPSATIGNKTALMGATQNATQLGTQNEDEDEESNSQVYKITVQPNYTLHMQLTYKPTDLGQHFFEFPIVAAGGGKSEGLRKVVHAEALRPRMLFSATDLNFKTKVVATGIQSVASVMELALHNADDYPIEWKIQTDSLGKFKGVFTVDPQSGILHPAQDCLVRAAFLPSEPIEYKANVNVYISPPRSTAVDAGKSLDPSLALNADESKPYLALRMKGQGTVPKLTFDRREIVLPIVPLGIRSRCLFYIVNEGYESLDVQYRLPNDQIRIPLTINFPEGQQIGITKPKIPVEIFFQSNKPISFCAKIEFLDNESGSYVLPVSGTTENCILTCHHYLHNNTDFYTLEGEPVMLQEKEDNSGNEQGAAPSIKTGSVSHNSMAGYGNQDMTQADFLVRWLNSNILKNQLDHFPQDLVNSNGRHLYEMIEFLSGKSVPNKAAAPPPQRMDNTGSSFRGNDRGAKQKSREMQKILQLMQQYEVLLNFLKQHGALLSSVRPEHFLSHEYYLQYQQSLNVGITRRQVDKIFFPKSMEAWLTSLLQTVKIFLLNRVTHKAFKTLPGMSAEVDQPVGAPVGVDDMDLEVEKKNSPELQGALDQKFLADSNVYSISECILLRWLNFHFARANRDRYSPRKVCCFDSDLEDSIVLAVVIQSHVPHCQAVQNMRPQCSNLDHHEENAMHILAALSEIGLQFPIQVSDIASPQAKDMLLFVMFLFQNLPHYVPKTTIIFSTMLGVNMTKNIELTNPSKKAISYGVQLVGSGHNSGSDFAIKDEIVKLEPRQTVSFPVEFHSRFSRIVDEKIIFTSRREGNVNAAAMVFKLRSRCTGRKPRKTIQVSAVLYEVGTVDVELENPFNEDAEFSVALRESTCCDAEKHPVASKRSEGMEAFYLSVTRCRVKAGGTGKITVSFLPFEAPAHFTALLGVFDSKAGEYYYELFGTSSPPLPLENYKMQVKAEASGTKDIILPLRNMQVERARSWLESRGAGPRPLPPDYIVYDVKVSSPYYTAPKQVVVHNGQAVNREGKGDGKGASRSGTNGALEKGDRRSSAVAKAIGLPQQVAKLVVEFWPKEPGVYPCTVTLTSDIDIRIYQFEGTGTAPNTHCSLTFTTQARKAITQEIPIVNPTDREWAIKPTFSQIGHEFDGPREFIAKKKGATGQATVTTYPLTFKPDWVCDVKAQLVLYNVGTNETYEYDLHGVAEEPLAEEHVVVKCEAREKTSHVFQVKNHSNLTAAFEVDGRGTGDYELTFQPLQAGQVTGCIIFRDTHTGHFTWYTVELMTLPPKPQQHLTLTCVVRQAVAVDIQLVNPLDDVVVFEVALTGDGLLGEAEFVLAPKETATYELVFSPLLPARSKGTAVFFNEIVGEFWYDLSLLAEAAPAEEIAPLECELGRTAQTVVHIDNPTGQEVVLKHRSTNKINFKVLNNRVVLPPLESTDITIEYSPSSLGVTEEAQIVFEHPLVGQWVYKAQGLGLPPLEARHVTVAAQVNRTVSSTIQFKNPFLETITIFIVLESKSEKGVFNLLSKKAKVQIGPLATTQIPFSFCPPTMTQHTAEIALSVMKPNLSWSYRIQGVAEAPADPTLHTFMVQAREALQTTYALTLIGLDTTPGDTHGDQLSCQLEVPPQHQAMVSKCFDISLDSDATAARASTQASRTRGKSDGQVFLKVNFSPLRPFIALCNLVITRASGGRWRFDLKLEATEPEVDDVISIQSPLNKPASVAFRLNNHTSVYSEFEAFFDAESAYEFTVQPTSGVLEPAGTNGTTFVVTYKPTEYGKPVQGKLIIQTEDVFWSYLVKGTHPKYTAPVVEKPKVATRLTKEMEMQLAKASQSRRKNFIKENMKGGVKD